MSYMSQIIKITFFVLFVLSAGCGDHRQTSINSKVDVVHHNFDDKKILSEYEKTFIAAGLVDIQKLSPDIKVDLKYSTKNNLFGFDAYGDLEKAYLQKDVAQKLLKAEKYLNKLMPDAKLIVFDAARPRRVQQIIWDSLKMPFSEKIKYASNPKIGGLHNFGAAVDLSIIDEKGKELDMGAPFDYMDELAQPQCESKMLKEGRLSQKQVDNRKLLRKIMRKAGFFYLQTEWWHFNSCTRKQAFIKYKIIE